MPEDQIERAAMLRRGIDFMCARTDYMFGSKSLEGMMMACIAQGIATRDGIIRTVPKYVGHSYPHVALVLDENTGSDPDRHCWWLGEDKVYRLHPIISCPPRRRPSKKSAGYNMEDEIF